MEKRKSRSNWERRTVTPALAILRPEGTVAYIGGSDTLPAPLTREEEQALFLSMDEQPETARQTLIEHNLRLVVYIARKFENTVSLDEPINTDWDGNELLLSDILGTDGDLVYRSIEETVERQMLARALSKLSVREKEIMRLRFGLGGCAEKTQKQVADIMGISQSYISRLEKRILSRLQRDMTQMG